MKQILTFFIFLFISSAIFSQVKEDSKNFDFYTYGLFRAHLATFGGDAEVQDATPRVGFKVDYYFGEKSKYSVFFGSEFAVNLIDNKVSFDADPNQNNDGFAILEFRDTKSAFSTRLGFVGVNFAKCGTIKIGKLNSVYKDVAGKTDIFNVLSGQASYVYSPTGANGGTTGTGRVDGAIIYRNSFGNFDIGLQTQMRANGGNSFFDGYGASLRYYISDELSVATAFNKAFLGPKYENVKNLQGLEGDAWYFAAGFVYNKGPLFISGIYTQQENGDFFNTVTHPPGSLEDIVLTVVYPGKGYEIVGSYIFLHNKLKMMVGFNYKKPETDNYFIPEGFRKRFYIIGAQYNFLNYASVYSEFRLEDSINDLGETLPNVFLVGLRVDFYKTWRRNVDLKY